MSPRATRLPTSPAPPSFRRRGLVRAAWLCLALGLTIVGVVQLRALWRKLPHPSLEALDRERAARAFADLQNRMSADARDGFFLAYASNQFTAALHEPDRLPEIRENARQVIAAVRGSALGRLQLAALAMLNLEHAGVPADQWWPQLRSYLTGLQDTRFPHHLPPYIAANARVYEGLGLDPATAWRTAASGSFAHGPLLQYATARLEVLAQAVAAGGDAETAAYLRGVRDRLLAEWVVEPGPPTLRMLAAELLADSLGERADDDAAARLAGALRSWRARTRQLLEFLPQGVPLFNTSSQPELESVVYPALRDVLMASLVLLGATLVVGTIAIAFAVPWFRAQRTGVSPILVLAFTIPLAGCTLALPRFFHGAAEADLRRVTVPEIGWMWWPFIAAAFFGALIFAVGPLASARRRLPRGPFTGCMAAIAWLTLAVAFLAAVYGAGLVRETYATNSADLLRSSWQNPPFGGAPQPIFDELRSWAGLSE